MLGLGDRPADAAVLARMAQRIAHRGPDDSSLYLDKQVGFGFRRLSIQVCSSDTPGSMMVTTTST